MIDLSAYVDRANATRVLRPRGAVVDVVGMRILCAGITAATGDRLRVRRSTGDLTLEVVGFEDGKLLCAALGSIEGLRPGAVVERTTSGRTMPVGEALLGRVVDAFGHALDGGPEPLCSHRASLLRPPPASFTRRPITECLETGVRALDALLPIGRGQRIGLFAGTGVGKSTLLAMLCRRARADVVVVGLVGERGREVGDFVKHALGAQGLARSVVVAATSDASPLVRAQGALAATAVAEHFRDRGRSVLLVMDSVTRFAMALREASLAAGEPPVTKGYTPSVFAALPALLERAGNTDGAGSITAIYTVLVDGDDLGDPIADAARGILDGHVVLSRALGERGVYPPVDVLRSLSRVATDITTPQHQADMVEARALLGAHRDAADLIRIGAYAAGSDPKIDAAREALPRLEALIRQRLDEHAPRAETLRILSRAVAPKR